MSAKDYHICPTLFKAYIAKVSKRMPNLMTNDRREITEGEILSLIDWYLDKMADEGEHGIRFASYAREDMNVIIKFSKKEEEHGR